MRLILKAEVQKNGKLRFSSADGRYVREVVFNKGLRDWMNQDTVAYFDAVVYEPSGSLCSLFRTNGMAWAGKSH